MKQKNSAGKEHEQEDSQSEAEEGNSRSTDRAHKRIDPRRALPVQAFVVIPALHSRTYGVCEVSRSGMFLAFRDDRWTRLELERNNVEPGTRLEITFAVSLPNAKRRFQVDARIARITNQGIGVQFATHNPPQLAALRELFPHASEWAEFAHPQDSVSRGAES